ncbi:MAG: phosphoenolpyruvate--protein phosphotransferase [Candidatus Adiutrix intracellularis]|nr:phosphoenolpyruvate--protein phosphotransferase [Candidatus Adiutrix intracellularis]
MNSPPPFVPTDSILTGVGASTGIAIGKALVYNHRDLHLPNYQLPNANLVPSELERLEKAKNQVREQLIASRESLPLALNSQAGIIDAHILLLDDPLLTGEANYLIREEHRNAEQAIACTLNKITTLMKNVTDEYISARLADVEIVGYSIITALLNNAASQLPNIPAGSILVVQDLNPAEVAKIVATKVAGLATERGGATSHTAIVAQALELPTVVGLKNIASRVVTGDTIILDGRNGHLIIRPNQETLTFYRTRQEMEWSFNAEIVRSAHLIAVTLDGHRVIIMSNMELEEELPAVMSYGSEGIGLYRTEFMYMNRKTLPTEKELFEVYRRIVESLAPNPVIIRTLDLGNDKIVESAPLVPLELNQALGLRGIRYCLHNRALFKTQLRAILRASVFGQVQIMLPMISNLDELRTTQAIISDLERNLKKDDQPYTPNLPIGVMIEIPATVFIARELAKEAAFFSVGTNDLIQYSLAVDRSNPEVSDIYQPLHPAILRMLHQILKIGRKTGTPISICGDISANDIIAPILIGLGATTLSMPPAAVPKIKRIIRMSSFSEMRSWSEKLLKTKTALEASKIATGYFHTKFPELLK